MDSKREKLEGKSLLLEEIWLNCSVGDGGNWNWGNWSWNRVESWRYRRFGKQVCVQQPPPHIDGATTKSPKTLQLATFMSADMRRKEGLMVSFKLQSGSPAVCLDASAGGEEEAE
ncbi:unnamed protein product [Linum trigynum]|uniref:Uncharacterized protein n=1 Tax=Linum trigynum TaxID=586398 RepID=A0AAV2CG70_9ROSI